MIDDRVRLTTEIVEAYVGHTSVSVDDLPGLIRTVYGALTQVDQELETKEELKPAVSIRASIKQDHLVCLVCGRKLKMLKRHLASDHGMTPDDYRRLWGLSAEYPMVAPDYAAQRSALAKEIGLGSSRKHEEPRRKTLKLKFAT